MDTQKVKGPSSTPKGKWDKECPICHQFINSKGFANHERAHGKTSEDQSGEEQYTRKLAEGFEGKLVHLFKTTWRENPAILSSGFSAILDAIVQRHQRLEADHERTGE